METGFREQVKKAIITGEEGGGPANHAVYAVLFVLCLATFHGMTDNYLFNDDFSWISAARYSMTPSNIISTRVIGFFRPLVNLSFYLLEKAAPGNYALHYSMNLALHLICSVIVFHIALALLRGRGAAAAAAALFAVSSVHTGAVLWISARTTLLSSALLLAAVLILLSDLKGRRAWIAVSSVLYLLALAAKETAIAGMLITAAAYFIYRSCRRFPLLGRTSLVSWSAITVIYLIARKLIMGGFVQDNWGPGVHMVRNAAAGFLYQLYPFPIFSIFAPDLNTIAEPSNAWMPEILVIILIPLVIWIGTRVKRGREAVLAAVWTLLSLLPAAAFRYRFFSTSSITQNRYYYLSSAGSVIIIVILMSALYNQRRRVWKYAASFLFILICAGYMVRVDGLEKRWDGFTWGYREIVRNIVESAAYYPDVMTLAIEDPPLAFPYIAQALSLTRREWKVVRVKGGREEASRHQPCLYISYSGEQPKKMSLELMDR